MVWLQSVCNCALESRHFCIVAHWPEKLAPNTKEAEKKFCVFASFVKKGSKRGWTFLRFCFAGRKFFTKDGSTKDGSTKDGSTKDGSTGH
jgi:hypothetical protein